MDDQQAQGAYSGAANGAMIGAAFGPVGAGVGALGGGILGLIGSQKRPKYQIQPEVEQNKALATIGAFGQNPAIAAGNAMADQTAAQDINTAQQYSSSTGSILNTLKAINSNRNKTKQGLAISDAEMRAQGRNNLLNTNKDIIDEYDKAWNYNVNEPYQNAVAQNRDIQKSVTENFWKILDANKASQALNLAL